MAGAGEVRGDKGSRVFLALGPDMGRLHGVGVAPITKPFPLKQAYTLRYELLCSSERAW